MSITSSLDPSAAKASTASAASSLTGGKSISQADFLSLLVTQMRNQDPTSPMDSQQMVAQLAQISQVSATTHLQSSVENLLTSIRSSQVSSSSSLLGRTVTVPSQHAALNGGNFIGAVQVPAGGGDVRVQISDLATGKVVRSLDLGQASGQGLAAFKWNGVASDGTTVADGTYGLSATVGSQQVSTYAVGTVAGVGNDSSQGAYLQVNGVGNVALDQVAQVN
jgi:flagellar basal-body rod modification protein FlgD